MKKYTLKNEFWPVFNVIPPELSRQGIKKTIRIQRFLYSNTSAISAIATWLPTSSTTTDNVYDKRHWALNQLALFAVEHACSFLPFNPATAKV